MTWSHFWKKYKMLKLVPRQTAIEIEKKQES